MLIQHGETPKSPKPLFFNSARFTGDPAVIHNYPNDLMESALLGGSVHCPSSWETVDLDGVIEDYLGCSEIRLIVNRRQQDRSRWMSTAIQMRTR